MISLRAIAPRQVIALAQSVIDHREIISRVYTWTDRTGDETNKYRMDSPLLVKLYQQEKVYRNSL